MISNAELDRLIAELGRHPLVKRELQEVKEVVFVSLNQSQPEGVEYAFCLGSGGALRRNPAKSCRVSGCFQVKVNRIKFGICLKHFAVQNSKRLLFERD